ALGEEWDGAFVADRGRPVGNAVGAPCDQLEPAAVRRHPNRVFRSGAAQCPPPGHLTAPIARPDTKCRWNRRNTATVGTAAMTVPAAMTLHDETNWPCSPSSAGGTGILSSGRRTV